MKIRVKQAHQSPTGDGRWIDHPVGQETDINPEDFADNLHEQIKPETEKPKKKSGQED